MVLQHVQAIFNLRRDAAVGEGFSRLGLLSGGPPPLSLFDMLQELDVPFVVCLLGWFFCLLGCGSFHFVPCIPPFFGCFGSFMSDKVSSFLRLLLLVRAFQNKTKNRCTTQWDFPSGETISGQGQNCPNFASPPPPLYENFSKSSAPWLNSP